MDRLIRITTALAVVAVALVAAVISYQHAFELVLMMLIRAELRPARFGPGTVEVVEGRERVRGG